MRAAKPRTVTTLRWAQWVLFAGGALALGYAGFSYFEAFLFQTYESWNFDKNLPTRPPQPPLFTPPLSRLKPSEGSPLGRIEIPRLGMSVMIVEGVSNRSLKLAAGHIPGTPFPDEGGNVGIAGHRDTFFRNLRKIERDDVITLTTLEGYFEYSVESTRVVRPDSVEVLDPSSESVLTLVTCYPFYYVGSAPERFIVRARQVGARGAMPAE